MAKRPFLNSIVTIGRQVDKLGFNNFDATGSPSTGRRDMPINVLHPRIRGYYREGGPWFYRYAVRTYGSNSVKAEWLGRYTYTGQFHPIGNPFGEYDNPWLFDGHVPLAIMQESFGYGASALAEMNPVKPDFTAAASLYELREVPEMLRQAVRGIIEAKQDYLARKFSDRRANISSHSKTAQWHLALSFGWLPVLSDIRNFIKARKNLDTRFRQAIRDEGRSVRRMRVLRDVNTQDYDYTYYWGNPYNPHLQPSLNVYAYGGGSATTRVRRNNIDRIWCVAQSRYLLPKGPRDEVWTRNMRRRIMGGRITPSALYSILPWSWFIDYFTDVGNFIEATDTGIADLLIYDYAYIMRTYEKVDRVDCTQYVNSSEGPKEVVASYTFRNGFKSRTPGSVFGFRLQADLSARQLGILGALGFSRLP